MAKELKAEQEPQAEQEQSMEEILASIRKIISEDDPGEGAVAAAADDDGDEDGDILDLSDPLPEDDFMDEVAEADAPPPADEPDDMAADAAADIDELLLVEEEPEPEPPPAPQPIEAKTDGLLSAEAAALSASALAELHASAVRSDTRIGDGDTVEGIVRELLRPMLKQWLDVHLPSMVETLVREEIQRIQKQGRD